MLQVLQKILKTYQDPEIQSKKGGRKICFLVLILDLLRMHKHQETFYNI